jgi:AraC family transcriptional regulator
MSVADLPDCRSLADWQRVRVSQHIELNLEGTIHTCDLAKIARLSQFHFSRLFKTTYGTPPHAYVMRRRVERAKALMLSTDSPLGIIAVESGMTDQAHFVRLFRRFTGETPGAWRRVQGQGRSVAAS